jgi:hypothetical protein
MPRDREHLALPEHGQPLERRKRPAAGPRPQRDRHTHGPRLIEEVDTLVNHLQQKRRDYPEGFNPANIFRLALAD